MIPAPPGTVAVYQTKIRKRDDTTVDHVAHEPVIAFDDDGEPLILGKRGLIRADNRNGFTHVLEDGYPKIVAVMPANGWRVEFTNPDGTKWSEPLVGWGLRASGQVVALDTDCDGLVEPLDEMNAKRIFHPESTSTAA